MMFFGKKTKSDINYRTFNRMCVSFSATAYLLAGNSMTDSLFGSKANRLGLEMAVEGRPEPADAGAGGGWRFEGLTWLLRKRYNYSMFFVWFSVSFHVSSNRIEFRGSIINLIERGFNRNTVVYVTIFRFHMITNSTVIKNETF